jgi:hypothetical protein
MKLINIHDEVIEEYKLKAIAKKNGSINIRAMRSMYGLPQSDLLANNKHSYGQSILIPGLWKYDTRPIQFTLVVDDFKVKYIGKEHA